MRLEIRIVHIIFKDHEVFFFAARFVRYAYIYFL